MTVRTLNSVIQGNYYNGSTALRCIKPIETPSLLEQMGVKPHNTAEKYCEAIELYLNRNKLNVQITEREMWTRAGL